MEELILYAKPELVLISEKKKLRDYQETDLNIKVVKLVYELLLLLGVKDGSTDQHNALKNHICSAYRHITIEQMEKAFELFVKGEFKTKPFQQLNAVVFGQVMNEYFEYEKDQTKIYRQNIQEFKQKATPMNEQEKNELMEIAIKKAIKHYKKTGEIEMAASKYDWLDSKGMLQGDQTNEEWNTIKKEKYKSVKNRLIATYSSAKASSQDQKTELKNIIKELQETKSGKAIAQSKTELLENYFNSL